MDGVTSSRYMINHHLIHIFQKTDCNETWGALVTCCSVHVAAVLTCNLGFAHQ